MAKQVGIIKITGTIDDITFYKMGDSYYARMKSSLTGKRFWKDPAFEGSRRSCTALGSASKLASLLYRTLPKEKKGRPVFQKLTGRIKLMIQDSIETEVIIQWFTREYGSSLQMEVKSTVKKQKGNIGRKAFNLPLPKYGIEVFSLRIKKFNGIEPSYCLRE
ncbi:MAG TPA: hypothetical protein VGD26_11085 [Chitinophagaceae bacterium]